MKRMTIAIALCASLAACGPSTVQSAGQVAEKGVTGANDLYVGASKTGEALVKAGLWDKVSFKAADARAYRVLVNVQSGRASIQELAAVCAALAGGK